MNKVKNRGSHFTPGLQWKGVAMTAADGSLKREDF